MCQLYLYANNTNARITLTNDNRANQERIQKKAAEMQTYMDAHHLKLNSEKAQLLIKNKGINNTHSELSLTMKGKKIIQSESIIVEEFLVKGNLQFVVLRVS